MNFSALLLLFLFVSAVSSGKLPSVVASENGLDSSQNQGEKISQVDANTVVDPEGSGKDMPPEKELSAEELAQVLCGQRFNVMIPHPKKKCSSTFFLCTKEDGAVERSCENSETEAYSDFIRQCAPRDILPVCIDVPSALPCMDVEFGEGNYAVYQGDTKCSAFFATCVHNRALKRRCASPLTRFDEKSNRCLFPDYVENCGGKSTAAPEEKPPKKEEKPEKEVSEKETPTEPETPKKGSEEKPEQERKEEKPEKEKKGKPQKGQAESGSSGIGAATAVVFAKEGCRVAISGRNLDNLNKTKALCVNAGLKESDVLVVKADMTIESDLQAMVKETIDHFGQLDILVNNAGISILHPNGLSNAPLEEFDKIINTDVRGLVQLTQLCVPHLKASKGAIVNVSSIASTQAFPMAGYYCMAKAALDQYTRCLALELAPGGVRVNSVNPGVIRTDIFFRTEGLPLTTEIFPEVRCPSPRPDNFRFSQWYLRKTITLITLDIRWSTFTFWGHSQIT